MNEDKNIFDDESIDYSDGIGELLKEKSAYRFSWKKTATVVIGLTLALVISVAAVSKIAKQLMIPAPDNFQSFDYANDEHSHEMASHDETTADDEYDDGVSEENKQEIEEMLFGTEKNSDQPVAPPVARTESAPKDPVVLEKEPITPTPKASQPVVQKTPVAPVTTSPKSTNKEALYRVVIGQFSDRQAAARVSQQLRADQQSAYVWKVIDNQVPVYRAQVGAFSREKSAKLLVAKLTAKGYSPYIVYR